uniref:NCK-associated protein 5 n=1 Tax=Nothobranchius rachovii TaxID=451742 RepID=A0A1A8PTB2_9TELE
MTASTSSKSHENIQQLSPVVSPVKQSKIIKSPGIKSPTKYDLQITRVSSNGSGEESIYDNLPCSPQKQRRQDHHCDVSQMEHRSLSPPLPPGRTTSLLLRSSSESAAKDQNLTGQRQSSTTGKPVSTATRTKDFCSILETRTSNMMRNLQHASLQIGVEGKPVQEISANIYQTSASKLPPVPIQETTESIQLSADRDATCCNENGTPFVLSTQSILQRSQQSVIHECGAHDKVHRKTETRCNSLDSDPVQPVALDSGGMLDWGFDEQGWLFKRSVSVSTRPLLKPVLGMNGAKARSQSFGARYMDRPSFNRSGKVRTQIKTHSGSSLNSLGDVLPGSMSCSSSYHCPMNRSLLNNFLIEEGLTAPSQLGSSNERLQSLKLQREQARRLQIEQQFSSAFGEPVSEEPERQSTITTIEEKVMLGIEENLHKSQEQERTIEVKQKSGSSLASWFGFRKRNLPAPSSRKTEPPKVKEEKREQKITSLLGGKNTKSDKKRDRRKSDGKDSSVGRRESHDAVRACISMPCPGISLTEIQGHATIIRDPKMQMMNRRADEQSLSPPSIPGSSSEEVSPSPLPRWRIPSSFKDSGHAGVPTSLSDSSITHIPSVPFPTVAFLQPLQPSSEPIMTSASVCDTQSRLPRLPRGGMEPNKLTHIKSKARKTPSQQKEQTRIQLAN